MNPELPSHVIIQNQFLPDFLNKDYEIIDVTDLNNDFSLVSYTNKNKEVSVDSLDSPNINVAIASAITSYSRIHMSKYLADPNLKIWATDTDSLVTDSVLETDNELGGMKLEFEYKEGTFIAPKVYGGISNTG